MDNVVELKQNDLLFSVDCYCSAIVHYREEMVESCRNRCSVWVADATANPTNWVRAPQPSVFQHTFRDRNPKAEIGPANGHVSSRKYIPRCRSCREGL